MTTEPARPKSFLPLLDYQWEDVESNARFRWNCWSRQTGKSFTKSLRRILRGLKRRRTQVFLSAGERQSRELMAKARQHCEVLKIATDYYDSRFFKNLSIKQLELVLPGDVRIIGLPANPQTARGFTGELSSERREVTQHPSRLTSLAATAALTHRSARLHCGSCPAADRHSVIAVDSVRFMESNQ